MTDMKLEMPSDEKPSEDTVDEYHLAMHKDNKRRNMMCYCHRCKRDAISPDTCTDFEFACIPWFQWETKAGPGEEDAPSVVTIDGKSVRVDQLYDETKVDLELGADANLVEHKKISIWNLHLCDLDALASLVLRKDPENEVNGWMPVYQCPIPCTPVGLKHNGKCVRAMFASTFHEIKEVNGIKTTKVWIAIRVFDRHQSWKCAPFENVEDTSPQWNLQTREDNTYYIANKLSETETEEGSDEADLQNPHVWWSARAGVRASECGFSKQEWAKVFSKTGLLSSQSIKAYIHRAYFVDFRVTCVICLEKRDNCKNCKHCKACFMCPVCNERYNDTKCPVCCHECEKCKNDEVHSVHTWETSEAIIIDGHMYIA
jgi:hypothetical protein